MNSSIGRSVLSFAMGESWIPAAVGRAGFCGEQAASSAAAAAKVSRRFKIESPSSDVESADTLPSWSLSG
jgi:hypothetical protein